VTIVRAAGQGLHMRDELTARWNHIEAYLAFGEVVSTPMV
jgi:hypothetical protein